MKLGDPVKILQDIGPGVAGMIGFICNAGPIRHFCVELSDPIDGIPFQVWKHECDLELVVPAQEPVREIRCVMVFLNGMVAVTDQHGRQMPEFQGFWPEVKDKIESAANENVEWLGVLPPRKTAMSEEADQRGSSQTNRCGCKLDIVVVELNPQCKWHRATDVHQQVADPHVTSWQARLRQTQSALEHGGGTGHEVVRLGTIIDEMDAFLRSKP